MKKAVASHGTGVGAGLKPALRPDTAALSIFIAMTKGDMGTTSCYTNSFWLRRELPYRRGGFETRPVSDLGRRLVTHPYMAA